MKRVVEKLSSDWVSVNVKRRRTFLSVLTITRTLLPGNAWNGPTKWCISKKEVKKDLWLCPSSFLAGGSDSQCLQNTLFGPLGTDRPILKVKFRFRFVI